MSVGTAKAVHCIFRNVRSIWCRSSIYANSLNALSGDDASRDNRLRDAARFSYASCRGCCNPDRRHPTLSMGDASCNRHWYGAILFLDCNTRYRSLPRQRPPPAGTLLDRSAAASAAAARVPLRCRSRCRCRCRLNTSVSTARTESISALRTTSPWPRRRKPIRRNR